MRELIVPLLALLVISGAGCAVEHPRAPARTSDRGATSGTTTARADAGADPTLASLSREGSPPTPQSDSSKGCLPGSEEVRRAESEITRVGAMIAGLAPDASPKPAQDSLAKLFSLPCLQLAQDDAPSLDADSGLALAHWWKERGGEWWLRHYLELSKPRTPSSFPTSVVAPTIRRALTAETKKRHPLAHLLCPIADPTCGRETAGWRLRADEALSSFAERHRAKWLDGDQSSTPPPSIDTCRAQAAAGAPEERYGAWRSCLARAREPRAYLPLGVVKAPSSGWLLSKGRRGHYAFCDEVRAYDLATGSAYVARSCSGLALRSDGSVDGAKTDAARNDDAFAGTLAVDALREAAWMTVLSGEVQENVVDAWGFALPEGVEPRSASSFAGLGLSFSTSSAQTTLAWSYVPERRSVLTGTLTWPEDYNHAGRAHAASLLKVAEASLSKGCPKAPPPATLDFGAASASSSLVSKLAAARSAACKTP